MKIIDKVKYKNVYHKTVFEYFTPICIICENEINIGVTFYVGSVTSIGGSDKHCNNFVCCRCVKSSIHAEKTVIPLLKILYGGKVRVIRHEYNNENNYKVFEY